MANAKQKIQPLDHHLGAQIAKARRLRGMTRTALALGVGLSEPQVARFERAQNRLLATSIWSIASFLELPVEWFYAGFRGGEVLAGQAEDGATYAEPTIAVLSSKRRSVLDFYHICSPVQQRLLRQILTEFTRVGADDHGDEDADAASA
jgi:transcriptional regulator with XRE-family HTH domain